LWRPLFLVRSHLHLLLLNSKESTSIFMKRFQIFGKFYLHELFSREKRGKKGDEEEGRE
jgi:hypothetical protein